MNDEYTPDIITLQDDDGNEFEFEIIGQLEFNENEYVALVPFDEDDEESDENEIEDETPFIIMRSAYDGEEEYLDIVENEEELTEVISLFEKLLEENYEIEDTIE